jgi:phospholipid/cholesterol/gamma-HCH transport system permease protein
MSDYIFRDNRITLHGHLVIARVTELYPELLQCVQTCQDKELALDLAYVTQIDSAGVAMIDMLTEAAQARGIALALHEAHPSIQHALTTFSLKTAAAPAAKETSSTFERLGDLAMDYAREFVQLLTLLADSIFYAALGLIRRKGQRKGEFLNQSMLIGMNAFPIVALIAFLIGFILALQSAAQLRQFGASIYVADLIAISMTREMGRFGHCLGNRHHGGYGRNGRPEINGLESCGLCARPQNICHHPHDASVDYSIGHHRHSWRHGHRLHLSGYRRQSVLPGSPDGADAA